ncbi:hypothetical protein SRHO_G00307620 [Serrasalmus rhombeus]
MLNFEGYRLVAAVFFLSSWIFSNFHAAEALLRRQIALSVTELIDADTIHLRCDLRWTEVQTNIAIPHILQITVTLTIRTLHHMVHNGGDIHQPPHPLLATPTTPLWSMVMFSIPVPTHGDASAQVPDTLFVMNHPSQLTLMLCRNLLTVHGAVHPHGTDIDLPESMISMLALGLRTLPIRGNGW